MKSKLRGEQNVWAEKIDGVAIRFEQMLNVEGGLVYYARPAFIGRGEMVLLGPAKYKVDKDLEALRGRVRTAIREEGW